MLINSLVHVLVLLSDLNRSYQQPQRSSLQAPSCSQSFRPVCGTYGMTHRKPNLIPFCHIYELLLSLLLPISPQHSLAHIFWPAPHPSQLLVPHIRTSGAPGFSTSHIVYAQGVPHSYRRSIFPYLRPSCRRGHLLTFRSSSHSYDSQRGESSFRS